MVGRYTLNMGEAEAATQFIVVQIAGRDAASIFADGLSARIGFIRKGVSTRTCTASRKGDEHPRSRGEACRVPQHSRPQSTLITDEGLNAAIANPGAGWADYMWPKPGHDTPSKRRTYVYRVPGKDVFVTAGVYYE